MNTTTTETVEFKKDFGIVETHEDIHPSTFPLRGVIKTFMKKNGYDIKHHEVIGILADWEDKKVTITFQFVHEDILATSIEPRYKVIFVEK